MFTAFSWVSQFVNNTQAAVEAQKYPILVDEEDNQSIESQIEDKKSAWEEISEAEAKRDKDFKKGQKLKKTTLFVPIEISDILEGEEISTKGCSGGSENRYNLVIGIQKGSKAKEDGANKTEGAEWVYELTQNLRREPMHPAVAGAATVSLGVTALAAATVSQGIIPRVLTGWFTGSIIPSSNKFPLAARAVGLGAFFGVLGATDYYLGTSGVVTIGATTAIGMARKISKCIVTDRPVSNCAGYLTPNWPTKQHLQNWKNRICQINPFQDNSQGIVHSVVELEQPQTIAKILVKPSDNVIDAYKGRDLRQVYLIIETMGGETQYRIEVGEKQFPAQLCINAKSKVEDEAEEDDDVKERPGLLTRMSLVSGTAIVATLAKGWEEFHGLYEGGLLSEATANVFSAVLKADQRFDPLVNSMILLSSVSCGLIALPILFPTSQAAAFVGGQWYLTTMCLINLLKKLFKDRVTGKEDICPDLFKLPMVFQWILHQAGMWKPKETTAADDWKFEKKINVPFNQSYKLGEVEKSISGEMGIKIKKGTLEVEYSVSKETYEALESDFPKPEKSKKEGGEKKDKSKKEDSKKGVILDQRLRSHIGLAEPKGVKKEFLDLAFVTSAFAAANLSAIFWPKQLFTASALSKVFGTSYKGWAAKYLPTYFREGVSVGAVVASSTIVSLTGRPELGGPVDAAALASHVKMFKNWTQGKTFGSIGWITYDKNEKEPVSTLCKYVWSRIKPNGLNPVQNFDLVDQNDHAIIEV